MAAGRASAPKRARAASRIVAPYPCRPASTSTHRERSPITATLTMAQRRKATPDATSVNLVMRTPACENRSMKTVAVIGASSNREKFGNKALRAFAQRGYTVIPINPTETEVEGVRAFRSVLDVPGGIDLATLYVPPPV